MRKWRRTLAVLLALTMVLTLLPTFALAADSGEVLAQGPDDPTVSPTVPTDPEDPADPTDPPADDPTDPPDPNVLAEGTCGDRLFWSLNTNGVLTISGDSEMATYDGDFPWEAYRDQITYVRIENGVPYITIGAFAGCPNLQEVEVPQSVTGFSDLVFSNDPNLTVIHYDGTVEEWNQISFGPGNDALDHVMICCTDGKIYPDEPTPEPDEPTPEPGDPRNVVASGSCGENVTWTVYDDNTLWISGEGEMTDIPREPGIEVWWAYVESGVTSIAEDAFNYYEYLRDVSIADTVTTIGDRAFLMCSGLWEITYSGTRAQWSAISIGAENDRLQQCSISCSDSYIPSNTIVSGMCGEQVYWDQTSYGDLVISGLGEMTSVPEVDGGIVTSIRIEHDVTSVAAGAFSGYNMVKSVYLSDTVTAIGADAFSGCDSLARVYYAGSMEQWDAISIGTGNEPLTNARIECSDGTLNAPDVTGEAKLLSEAPAGAVTVTKEYYPTRIGVVEMTYDAAGGTITNYHPFFADLDGLNEHQIEAVYWACERQITNGTTETTFDPGSPVTRGQVVTFLYRLFGTPDVSGVSNPYSDVGDNEWFYNAACWLTTQEQIRFYTPAAVTTVTSAGDMQIIGGDPGSFYPYDAVRSLAVTLYVDAADESRVLGIESIEVDNPAHRLPEPCGENTKWTMDENGVLTISGTGAVTSSPWRENGNTQHSIRAVIVEEGVTSLCTWAFDGCANLTNVSLPKSLTTISGCAFQNCGSPKRIDYAGTKAQWAEIEIQPENGWLTGATIHCADGDLTPSGTCGEGVTWALDDNGVLTISGNGMITADPLNWDMKRTVQSIVINEGVTGCVDWVMGGFEQAQSVTLPATFESLGHGAFTSCTALRGIHAAEENPVFTSVDGVLFSKDLKELLRYPRDHSGIYDIPDGVETIDSDAFGGDNRIERLTFPASLRHVESAAFVSCLHLTDVYYPGTLAEWNALDIGADNDSLKSAFVHCADGDILPTGKCGDNLTWALDENGTLTISGTGAMSSNAAWRNNDVLRSKIRSVVINEGVTNVFDSAFSECQEIKSVTLPESLKSIGRSAFQGCGLTSVTIPAGVTKIYEDAFYYCSDLQTVVISGAPEIGDEAFGNCSALQSVTIPDGVTVVGRHVFSGTPIYDDPANWIDGAFYYGGILLEVREDHTSFEIRPGTRVIADAAFQSCWSLESVTIPEGVVYIGHGAFWNTALRSVTLPESLKGIGSVAFKDCHSLESISFPAGLERIGNRVLDGTPLYDDPANWTDGVFYYDSILLTVTSSDTSCTLRPDTRLIAENAFGGSSFTNVVISEGITRIPDGAFTWCWSLQSITLPASLESVGSGAFVECTALREVISNGTTAQWRAVRIEAGNDALLAVAVRCADGTVNPSGQCGENVFWELDQNGVLTVSGTGEMTSAPSLSYDMRRTVKAIVIEDGVTSVASSAFSDYESVSSITIPLSVTAVDRFGFFTCTTETTDVYYGGTKAQWRAIRVEEGSDLALDFVHCTDGDIDPSGQCGDDVFWSLDRDGVVTISGTGAMWDKISEDTSVGLDRLSVFHYKPRIRGVVVESGVTRIGNAAFDFCHNIRSATIPMSVTSIGDYAFGFYLEGEVMDVYYAGTEARWNSLAISKTGNDPLRQANLHFGDDPGPLTIVTQPQDVSGLSGELLSIHVEALGKDLTYRWQFKPTNKETWADSGLSGYNTDTLQVRMTSPRDGQRYRCVITDADGAYVVSEPATLTLGTVAPPEITLQPQDFSGVVGSKALMHVEAAGSDLRYQWQYCAAGSENWSNSSLPGCDTDTMEVAVKASRDGQCYRCVVTDRHGQSVTSESAALTVRTFSLPEITLQPENAAAAIGQTAVFRVEAAGEDLTYQWQYRPAGKDAWTNSGMAGSTTSALQVPVKASRIGQSYRCIVRNAAGQMVISEAATLLEATNLPPEITLQPQSVTAAAGQTAEFRVEATGEGLIYQWQYSPVGTDRWTNSGFTGSTTDTLQVPAKVSRNGQRYRCVVTNAAGVSITSEPAVLTVQ